MSTVNLAIHFVNYGKVDSNLRRSLRNYVGSVALTTVDSKEANISMSRALGNNLQSVGKQANLWKTLYMTVAFAAIS